MVLCDSADPDSSMRLSKKLALSLTLVPLWSSPFVLESVMEPFQVGICHSDEAWQAARALRQKTFFDRLAVEDPYLWTFQHPDHQHFVLRTSNEFIGYAHLQLWPNQRAALRIIVIDEQFRRQGYGEALVAYCEQCLLAKGVKRLETAASPSAVNFYRKLGFHDMEWDDPEHHPTDPTDTPLGKELIGDQALDGHIVTLTLTPPSLL
jgi:GNAT superfamily N-acetyltransferase